MPTARSLALSVAIVAIASAGCGDPPPPPAPPPPGGMARGLAPSHAPPFAAPDGPEVFEARQRLNRAAVDARRELEGDLGPLTETTSHVFTQAEGWRSIRSYYDSVLTTWDSGALDMSEPASAAWWTQGRDAFVVVHVPATDSVAYVRVLRPRAE